MESIISLLQTLLMQKQNQIGFEFFTNEKTAELLSSVGKTEQKSRKKSVLTFLCQ